jgi:hypothetical protein
MLSMVPMISFIRLAWSCRVAMPLTVEPISCPAFSVSCCMVTVSWLTCCITPELVCTVSATWRTLAVACSRLAACDWVRPDRSLASRTSSLPVWPSTEAALRTSATSSDRRVIVAWNFWLMTANSSVPNTSTSALRRSPSAATSMAAPRRSRLIMVAL